MAIRGIHGLLYSSDPDGTRAFFRDAMKLPHSDVGGGWLIFDFPEGDLGIHPTDEDGEPKPNTHDVSFYCDDIHATMAELRARGVEFKQEPADHGYGHVTYFTAPGGVECQLYEPKYEKRVRKPKPKAKAKPKTKAKAKPRRR
ncbi:MAG TPA: VOC family protein [Kofleriaceae bacterium]|nr:VOC family protein [Kofleriaceae bacterium]